MQYTAGIFLTSFPVLGPVHATPEEFENGALFLRLGLPSTLIRRNCPPKTELFEKALENNNFKTEQQQQQLFCTLN